MGEAAREGGASGRALDRGGTGGGGAVENGAAGLYTPWTSRGHHKSLVGSQEPNTAPRETG